MDAASEAEVLSGQLASGGQPVTSGGQPASSRGQPANSRGQPASSRGQPVSNHPSLPPIWSDKHLLRPPILTSSSSNSFAVPLSSSSGLLLSVPILAALIPVQDAQITSPSSPLSCAPLPLVHTVDISWILLLTDEMTENPIGNHTHS